MYKSDSALSSTQSNNGKEGFLDYDFAVKINNNRRSVEKFYRTSFLNIFKTSEKLVDIKWYILPELKKINNYNCQKAITEIGGRKWIAWFTNDIPISKGPYIFRDLPGLIISIYDDKDNFNFEVVDIYKNSVVIFNGRKPIIVSKSQLLKLYLDYFNDPFKELKLNSIIPKIETAGGSDVNLNYRKVTERIQSDLKKYNNPIDLHFTVIYP